MRADEVRLCLKLAAAEYLVVFPTPVTETHGPPVTAEVFEPTRLAVPILASNRWIGYIQIGRPCGGEFNTQHKRFLQATAAVLGRAADRALLWRLQRRFANHVVHGHKIQSMLHRVWVLTNSGAEDFAKTLNSVISAVRRTVPCRAVITRVWNRHGEELYHFTDAADPEILALVQNAVQQACGQSLSSNAVWARRYPAEQEALGGPESSGDSAPSLGAVMVVPLQRLRAGRGVMALGRDGESPEFSTEEKQALCIVSGLLNGPNGD